ncbi:MAG: fibronectin type III domain-containing protein [Chloroflexi bacterium]|nr:fibronectin type III domain-containing protein [Chloroflexota bacterium]
MDGDENCNPNTATPPVNQGFCAYETYTFVVGPMADLAVEDGGASGHAAADQSALAIVAVNNGPDLVEAAQVTELPTDAEVIHISHGSYDGSAGVWNIGELKVRGYYRSRGVAEPTLVLSATAGSEHSVKISSEDYAVCIGGKDNSGDLDHTTKEACEADTATGVSWQSTPVYDYNSGNNSATITATQGAGVGPGNPRTRTGTTTVMWDDVETLYGLPVARYEVQWLSSDWTMLGDAVTKNQHVDTAPSGRRDYRVRAVNLAGVAGPWSAPVSAVISRPAPVTEVVTVPSIVAKGAIADQALDVGEAGGRLAGTTAADLFDLRGAAANYTVTQRPAGTFPNISDGDFDAADGFTIPTGVSNAPNDAGKSATITITAVDSAVRTNRASVSFRLTVLQNPIEQGGVMVANPPNWGSATNSACAVSFDGAAIYSRQWDHDNDGANDDRPLALTAGANLVSGGECITTGGDPVEVAIKNTSEDPGVDRDAVVYITQNNGSEFTRLMPQLGQKGYQEEVFVLPLQTDVAGDGKPGERVIKVEKDMATEGRVYLIGYLPADAADNLDQSDSTFSADADFVVEVVFLEAPDRNMSTVAVPDQIGATGTETITVVVKDRTGNVVENANVDFRLVNADSRIRFSNNRRVLLGESDSNGMETAIVNGLPTTGPVRVGVEVSIGDDITKMVYLIRKGDPATVNLSAYADTPITRATGESFFVRAVAYDSAMNDVSDDTGANLMVAGSDDDSQAAITVSDAPPAEWWDTLDCPQRNDAVMPRYDEPAAAKDDSGMGIDDPASPYCAMYDDLEDAAKAVARRAARQWFKVAINDDATPAPAGVAYALKATAGTGDDAVMSDPLEFAVLGGIDLLELTGPEGLGSSQAVSGFAVAATSDDGAMPGNVQGEMVTITFTPTDAASVVGSDNRQVELDAQGMASFSILADPGRLSGGNLIIIASHGEGDDQILSAPLEVGAGPTTTTTTTGGTTGAVETTLGPPSGLTATAGDGQVTLSWTPGANADIHWVFGLTQEDRAAGDYSNLISTQANSNDGHVVMGLENGVTYDFVVRSGQVVDGVKVWHDTWSNYAPATPRAAGSG